MVESNEQVAARGKGWFQRLIRWDWSDVRQSLDHLSANDDAGEQSDQAESTSSCSVDLIDQERVIGHLRESRKARVYPSHSPHAFSPELNQEISDSQNRASSNSALVYRSYNRLLHPEDYFENLSAMQNGILRSSAVFLYRSLMPHPTHQKTTSLLLEIPLVGPGTLSWSNSMSSINIESAVDSSAKNQTALDRPTIAHWPQDKKVLAACNQAHTKRHPGEAEQLFHLLECRNMMQVILLNIKKLEKNEYCVDKISLLALDPTRKNIVNLVSIPISDIQELADEFNAVLIKETKRVEELKADYQRQIIWEPRFIGQRDTNPTASAYKEDFAEAIMVGDVTMVRLLLIEGYKKDGRPISETEFNNGLLKAAENGHLEMFQLLLQLHPKPINGRVAFDAFEKKLDHFANLLIKHGLYFAKGLNEGRKYLTASRAGLVGAIKLLLDHNIEMGSYSGQAVYAAAVSGQEEIVRLLLHHGADISKMNGGNAVLKATVDGHVGIVRLLLEKGVNINRGSYGELALQEATARGHQAIVQLLRSYGVSSDHASSAALPQKLPEPERATDSGEDAELAPYARLDQLCHQIWSIIKVEDRLAQADMIPARRWRFIVHLLNLAVVSYAGAHLERFDEDFLQCSLEPIDVVAPFLESAKPASGYHTLILRRRSLLCLDKFLGRAKVWVFHLDDDQAEDGLFLRTDATSFADIWGPMWKSPGDSDSEDISHYAVGNGAIVPWPRPDMPELNLNADEVFCHWLSDAEILEHGMTEFHLPRVFNSKNNLVIGANHVPQLRHNRSCRLSSANAILEFRNQGNLRPIGTSYPSRYVDADAIQLQGGYSGVNIGWQRIFKRRQGQSWKDSLFETWTKEPLQREIEILEVYIGLEISQCTQNARRISLLHLLNTGTIRRYLQSKAWSQNTGLKSAFDDAIQDVTVESFRTLWENQTWRSDLGEAISLCLKVLRETGLDNNGNLMTLWTSPADCSGSVATIRKSKGGWLGLLKDTPTCCTMAVLDSICLQMDLISECRHLKTFKSLPGQREVLQTALYVNSKIAPEGIKLKASGRNRDILHWNCEDVPLDFLFFLGEHSLLRVVVCYKRHLLVRWESPIIPARIPRMGKERIYHEEDLQRGISNLLPLPIFVLSN